MRYFRQPDKYSCGPTAIANALVWAGEKVKFRELIPFLQFSCHTRNLQYPDDYEKNGTYDTHFVRTLRYVVKGILRVQQIKNPTVASMRSHLEKGGAIVLGYCWHELEETGDHYAFIPELHEGKFVVVNDHNQRPGRKSRLRSEAKLREFLTYYDKDHHATVWFLSRKAAKTE